MNPLFINIEEKYQEKLLYTFEAHTFTLPKNTRVLNFIKNEDFIGYVISGYMQIIRTDYNGNTTIIEELEENSVFGTVISSLNNSEYEIITKEESKIRIIDYNKIIEEDNNKLPYFHQFFKNLIEIASQKIALQNEHIEILTKKTIRDKLLEYFKIISEKNGSKNIYLTFTLSELANYLAVDRCAMSRELKNLKEEGFIKLENKKITLLY